MYAVGQLISRGVYTVSGPFHPFGGAVDIVVVQQQDGSFKSSPWYVRFGKFQGVLKTSEKVVDIAVNGVEAGFHMYLDRNGEAYFLRDADSNIEEEDFVVSPASSGDEREVPMQDSQLRKSKSTSCDSSTMEADVGDGKIFARTTSRRSTILERMFGRKSIKNNVHAVDRVSSLERAEIAAELLDSNWSTNLSRGSKNRSSNDEPSKSRLKDAGNYNQVETTNMVLPECSFDHEKAMGSNCDSVDSSFGSPHGGRRSLGDGNDHYVQTTSVKEETVEIYTIETGDLTDRITSTIDRPGSESLSNDLGADSSINKFVDTQGELCGNSENVTRRVIHTNEILPHGTFEIHAIETDISNGKNEVVSQFVTVETDGVDQNYTDTNSPTHGTTDLSSKRHCVPLIASGQDACQEKEVIISSSETVESSYDVPSILADKVRDAADISLVDDVQLEERPRVSSEKLEQVIFEERSQSYYGASGNKEDMNKLDVQEHEVLIFEGSRLQISQANVPDKDISVDTVANDHVMCSTHGSDMDISVDTVANDPSAYSAHDLAWQHDLVSPDASSSVPDKDISVDAVANDHVMCSTHGSDLDISVDTLANDPSAHSAHDLTCQHDLVSPDASSSVVEILSYVHENDCEDVTKDFVVENKTCNGELDDSVIQTSKMGDESSQCIAQSAKFPNKVEDEGSPIISEFSTLSKIEVENTKLEDDENKSSSASGVEIGFVLEAIYEPRDEAEPVVSFSEFVEEIQFQFSDTESFADRKTIDDVIANKAAGAGVDDESDCDVEGQGGDDTGLEHGLENCSDLLRHEASVVPIPGSELQSGDNNVEAKSLPNLRSHIHDLERSDSFQLSRSLQSNGENNGVDPVKSMNSGFPEQEPEGTGNSEENSGPPELTKNAMPDDKHTDDLKVDLFNPFVELSLCRHLLSEGMGVDAACKAFDAEKVTLEKFHATKQSLIKNNKLVVRISGCYFPWDAAAPIILGMVSFREEQVFESQGMIKVERVEPSTAQGGSWRIWPFSFRRTSTINIVQPVCESVVESSLSTPVKELDGGRNKPRGKRMERKVRSLTPTSEELASLVLREGRNVVTFTFSTAMLGRQQVDARIYLWKWNTRIVISDVDGTITKSDVLGQFMPMVGVDWSQNGVAHLFSAIKENGYQLLFLSARAISQAHLTRQFLFNLKQDGKALPDGPVVISPDGLFPSLFREVIRRAPHEFKISCLEAIKALFPPDSNPFYAGFGNRNTDELSYLKVGIPMGKIFIINPKGEVAVNRRVDTRSYTSLHALVNGMFPPISSSSEQEDYNTWNYWKIPLPSVDI